MAKKNVDNNPNRVAALEQVAIAAKNFKQMADRRTREYLTIAVESYEHAHGKIHLLDNGSGNTVR